MHRIQEEILLDPEGPLIQQRFTRDGDVAINRYTEETLDQLTLILAGNHLSIETGRGEIVTGDVIDQ